MNEKIIRSSWDEAILETNEGFIITSGRRLDISLNKGRTLEEYIEAELKYYDDDKKFETAEDALAYLESKRQIVQKEITCDNQNRTADDGLGR